MTDLPDAETAWEAWQPKPERHWTVAKAAFLAGFAAASGPWAEQLDAAKAEIAVHKDQANRMRESLEEANERVADLRAELDNLRDRVNALADAEHSVEHLYETEELRYTGVVMADELRAIVRGSDDE